MLGQTISIISTYPSSKLRVAILQWFLNTSIVQSSNGIHHLKPFYRMELQPELFQQPKNSKFQTFLFEELLKPFLSWGRLNKRPTVGRTGSACLLPVCDVFRLQEGLTTWKVPEDNFEERHGFGKTWQAKKLLRSLTGNWGQNKLDGKTY